MQSTADHDLADRAVSRGLASLHHQEAHHMPVSEPASFEDEPPSPREEIARLKRTVAVQSRRLDAVERRLAEIETLKERLDVDSGMPLVPTRIRLERAPA